MKLVHRSVDDLVRVTELSYSSPQRINHGELTRSLAQPLDLLAGAVVPDAAVARDREDRLAALGDRHEVVGQLGRSHSDATPALLLAVEQRPVGTGDQRGRALPGSPFRYACRGARRFARAIALAIPWIARLDTSAASSSPASIATIANSSPP